jgi:hypothetical protein
MISSFLLAPLLSIAPAGGGLSPALFADSTRVTVSVSHAASKRPLPNASISSPAQRIDVRTDSAGFTSFRVERDGIVQLRIILEGFVAVDTAFDSRGRDSVHLAIGLRSVQDLPVSVVEATPTPTHLAGFAIRRTQGRGRYITPEQLRGSHDRRLVEMLERMPGLQSDVGANGAVIMVAKTGPTSFVRPGQRNPGTRQPGDQSPASCAIAIFRDGVYLPDVDLGNERATGYDAVEFYSATNIPPEFKRPGTQCGVLLLWSR